MYSHSSTDLRLIILKQSWDLVAHFEPISKSTPTDLLSLVS